MPLLTDPNGARLILAGSVLAVDAPQPPDATYPATYPATYGG